MLDFTHNFHLEIDKPLLPTTEDAHFPSSGIIQIFPRKWQFNTKLNKVIIVLFLVLGFCAQQSFAQRDQITTQAGEKIRCRILDETPTRFVYAYLSPSGKVLKNEIFKNLVTDFKYNFYPNDIVTKGNKLPEGLGEAREVNSSTTKRVDTRKSESTKTKGSDLKKEPKGVEKSTAKNNSPKRDIDKKEEKIKPTSSKNITPNQRKYESEKLNKKEEKEVAPLAPKKNNNEFSNYMAWRVGGKGGFGNRLTKILTDNPYSSYQEKLLRGFTWGGDVAYFPIDNFGFGMMFNNFQSSNKADGITYINDIFNVSETGNIANKRSIKYVGPVFYFRKNIDFKTMVILGLSPGAYFYKDKGNYDDANYTFKGMDFGAAATLGIDFLLGNDITGRDIILSVEAGYNYGKMRALDFGMGGGAINLAKPIDLSRVDFTVGLRFTRYPAFFRAK
ncbi:hypothetical protein Emtol_2354 [Emticicia oligotrophica DSM 17448]|uniref:Outer membrane protein beta-barrel domain-containing protein n=1 Tax=Emticicia oligotrophica (strain DSM 17448 / CIP 109782 / MTCC 6937 / GPTSA100-15) TaxID=929562 RepID=A0ABM5N216_EMTOG|nr:hypothetical protein [Emticicia oligotrophica]AFK03491.1 hypothetical protein Emtol_2354 [Emticicia oligotrophica DSM 17448]